MNIVWKRPDGTLAITYPVIEGVDLKSHAVELIERGDVPADHEMVAIGAEIPPRCEFRNAMVWDGSRVVHDMVRARDMRREQLRGERTPAMASLDVEYQRADERGDAKAKTAVAARKQALRDITKHPDIDKAKTLDDLRAVKVPE